MPHDLASDGCSSDDAFQPALSAVARAVGDAAPPAVGATSGPRPEELGIGLLFWNMRDAAIIGEAGSGRIVLWNPAAEAVFGYAAEEVIGQSLEILAPEALRERHRTGIARFAATGRGPLVEVGRPIEVPALRKGGAEMVIELVLTPIEQDQIPGRFVLALIRDVTERKRSEAALQAANRELQAFSYSVSHDLRAPLRAVAGFSAILLEDHAVELPEEARRYLSRIQEAGQRMGHLIDGLLAFLQLRSRPLVEQTVAPVETVHAVLGELARERAGREVEIVIDDLPTCQADPALLKQVFAHLLSNALKYTRERQPARIQVGSRADLARPGERVYFVRDNGTGFDLAYADKVFGVFQRLDWAEDAGGTGVGLALVQRIVDRHGGRVWADAAVGQGATFFVTLPAAEPERGTAGVGPTVPR